MGQLQFVGAGAGRREDLLMEEGINPESKKGSQSFRWLQEIDQILVVGMKYGPRGTQEAVKKVRQLAPAIGPAEVWRRMRHLREKKRGKRARPVEWSEAAIEILRDGYRSGGGKKSEAITTVRALYPGLAGHAVSRFARSQGWLDEQRKGKQKDDRRPWTNEEEDELFRLAGYEPVKVIAQRLRRSEQSVRSRLKGLAISARVTDGWSLRRIQQTLHVSYRRLRRFIGNGLLTVRDPRVSAISLVRFRCRHSLTPQIAIEEKTAEDSLKENEGYSWGRVAKLLGVNTIEVQKWIANGELKVMDPSVTDRSFEAFCRQQSSELNLELMDPEIAKWLIDEYGLDSVTTRRSRRLASSQRQALIIRPCPKCKRSIRGNGYFGHIPACCDENVTGRWRTARHQPASKLTPGDNVVGSYGSISDEYVLPPVLFSAEKSHGGLPGDRDDHAPSGLMRLRR
jgi:hypothetical protein